MAEPVFINIKDFSNQEYLLNIKHIFEISSFTNIEGSRTTVSYYQIPDCEECDIIHIRTTETKESILNRIQALKSK